MFIGFIRCWVGVGGWGRVGGGEGRGGGGDEGVRVFFSTLGGRLGFCCCLLFCYFVVFGALCAFF